MPLTQKRIDSIKPTGKPFKLYDRDGLMVRVTAAGKARWVWRGVVKGKRIELGMASTRFRSLREAREVAFENTRTARLGGDPRATAASKVPTFAEAAAMYLEIQSPDWGRDHATKVRRLLERHAFPILGDLVVDRIETADLMRVLVPLWRRQRVTGHRLRQRIAGVMAWAVAAGYRQDDPTSTPSAVLPAGRTARAFANDPPVAWRKSDVSSAGCPPRRLEYWTYYATLHPSSYQSGGASPPEPPSDAEPELQPARLPQFVPVLVFGRGDRPGAGGTGPCSRGREPGRAVLRPQRRA